MARAPKDPFIVWEVIGGVEAGGLLVRQTQEVGADALPALEKKLETGALIIEKEISESGNRLRYSLLKGLGHNGPDEGWVTCKTRWLKKTDLTASDVKVMLESHCAPIPPEVQEAAAREQEGEDPEAEQSLGREAPTNEAATPGMVEQQVPQLNQPAEAEPTPEDSHPPSVAVNNQLPQELLPGAQLAEAAVHDQLPEPAVDNRLPDVAVDNPLPEPAAVHNQPSEEGACDKQVPNSAVPDWLPEPAAVHNQSYEEGTRDKQLPDAACDNQFPEVAIHNQALESADRNQPSEGEVDNQLPEVAVHDQLLEGAGDHQLPEVAGDHQLLEVPVHNQLPAVAADDRSPEGAVDNQHLEDTEGEGAEGAVDNQPPEDTVDDRLSELDWEPVGPDDHPPEEAVDSSAVPLFDGPTKPKGPKGLALAASIESSEEPLSHARAKTMSEVTPAVQGTAQGPDEAQLEEPKQRVRRVSTTTTTAEQPPNARRVEEASQDGPERSPIHLGLSSKPRKQERHNALDTPSGGRRSCLAPSNRTQEETHAAEERGEEGQEGDANFEVKRRAPSLPPAQLPATAASCACAAAVTAATPAAATAAGANAATRSVTATHPGHSTGTTTTVAAAAAAATATTAAAAATTKHRKQEGRRASDTPRGDLQNLLAPLKRVYEEADNAEEEEQEEGDDVVQKERKAWKRLERRFKNAEGLQMLEDQLREHAPTQLGHKRMGTSTVYRSRWGDTRHEYSPERSPGRDLFSGSVQAAFVCDGTLHVVKEGKVATMSWDDALLDCSKWDGELRYRGKIFEEPVEAAWTWRGDTQDEIYVVKGGKVARAPFSTSAEEIVWDNRLEAWEGDLLADVAAAWVVEEGIEEHNRIYRIDFLYVVKLVERKNYNCYGVWKSEWGGGEVEKCKSSWPVFQEGANKTAWIHNGDIFVVVADS